MAGYTRNDTANNIADGNIINASDLDGEFDAVQSAFNASTGHTHDGTSGEGAPIEQVGPVQDLVITASEVKPKTTDTLDLGTNLLQFKDLYIEGSAFIDGLGESMLVDGASSIQFRDSALAINSSTDGQLDIDADIEVEITVSDAAGIVDINANSVNISNDLKLDSDSAILSLGADSEVTLTHLHNVGTELKVVNATTSSVTDILDLQVESSGTPAVGIGTGLTFSTETASGNVEVGGAVRSIATGLTPTAEEIDLVFYSMRNGSLTEAFRYDSDGDTFDVTGSINADNLDVDNININGNTITSTDTNGNIALTPDGTGEVDISKVDIDSGTIDGVTIGGASAGAATFTGLTVTDSSASPISVNRTVAGGVSIQFRDSDDNGANIGTGSLGGVNFEAISSGVSAGSMRFTQNGDLGIGTIEPGGDFEIRREEAPVIRLRNNAASIAQDEALGKLQFYNGDTSAGNTNLASEIRAEAADSFGRGGNLVFRTNDTERMRLNSDGSCRWTPDGTNADMTLDASGNLLVGTTSESGILQNRLTSHSAGKGQFSVIDTTAYSTADVGGAINLGGNYRSTGDAQAFCRIEAVKENTTNNNYSYALQFLTTASGNANFSTNAMRIDSSGNVGIGTGSDIYANSIVHAKDVNAGGDVALRVQNSSTTSGSTTSLRFNNTTSNYSHVTLTADRDRNLIFKNTNDTVETARIDSSGNLLVGKTSVSYLTEGFEATPSSSFQANAMTGDGKEAVLLARLNSDGNIIEFRKDSAPVGSIKAEDGDIVVGNDTSGLKFRDTDFIPRDMDDTTSDGKVTLGSSGSRFQDLYLSGTAIVNTLLALGTSSTVGRIRTPNQISIADDSSITLTASVAGGYLLNVYESGTGSAAVYFINFAGQPVILAQNGSVTFSTSDVDGNYCVIKSTGQHATTFKNRFGASRNFHISLIGGNPI